MSLTGTAVAVVVVCALGAGCAFDPSGTNVAADDDPAGTVDAAPVERPADAGGAADAATMPVPNEPGVLRCRRASVAPLLDGDLGEWPAGGQAFDMSGAAQIIEQTLGYVPSMAADFRCQHDADNLYFAIHVLDDHLVTDSAELYNDDAAHLYLDARGDAQGSFAADDHELVVRADGMFHDYATGAASLALSGQVLADAAAGGFDIEIAIAKSSLGVAALPARLGFDLAISDDDGFDGFAYGLWYLSARPSCTSCCATSLATRAWCDTTTFGTLVLD